MIHEIVLNNNNETNTKQKNNAVMRQRVYSSAFEWEKLCKMLFFNVHINSEAMFDNHFHFKRNLHSSNVRTH